MEDGRESPTLHLDLSNFQEGSGSRYVLTSPRSLEACARLRVKPVELLHKSLREVREENPKATWQQVNDLFLAEEKERCWKLRMCRELRETLMKEDDKPDKVRFHTSKHALFTTDHWNPPPVLTDLVAHQSQSVRGLKDYPRASAPPPSSLRWASNKDPREYPKAPCSPPQPSIDHQIPSNVPVRNHREYTQVHSSYSNHWNPPAHSTDHLVPSKSNPFGLRTLRRSLSQGDLFRPEEKVHWVARKVEKEVHASVPDRDKKIAALMLWKHQEEEMSKKRRQRAQRAWDDFKTKESCIKAALNKKDWLEQFPNHRRQSWGSQSEWQTDAIGYLSGQNNVTWKTPEHKDLLKYSLKMAKEDLKRQKLFQEPVADVGDKVPGSGLQLEERMQKAFEAKTIKVLQNKKNLQIKNEYEKLRHSKLKEKVDNQMKAEEYFKRISIQEKDKKSQVLHGQLVEQRKKGLSEKAFREDELTFMARIRAMRQEKEQMEHKRTLARLSDHRIRQARDALERSIQGKAERARELNVIKESTQQALKKKVDQEKENQRKEIAQVIRMKDRKSEKIRKEKEATIEEGRRIARASFHLRESIRQQTKSRTFDQMALQAQLNATLIRTIP